MSVSSLSESSYSLFESEARMPAFIAPASIRPPGSPVETAFLSALPRDLSEYQKNSLMRPLFAILQLDDSEQGMLLSVIQRIPEDVRNARLTMALRDLNETEGGEIEMGNLDLDDFYTRVHYLIEYGLD